MIPMSYPQVPLFCALLPWLSTVDSGARGVGQLFGESPVRALFFLSFRASLALLASKVNKAPKEKL